MFAFETSFNASLRPKSQSLSLISWLCFNSRQSKHYDIGFYGEKVAQALFQEAGYLARKPSYHGIDLEVRDPKNGEFVSVEVKTARMSERLKSWQFCLNKEKNCSSTNAAYILLILIAEKTIFTYLIPSEFFGKTKSFTISHPDKYRGKIAPFRNRGALSFAASQDIYNLARLQ